MEKSRMIDVTTLHKAYGDETVLDDASFSVGGGTIAAMVGPNGSGKTTALHVLAGLATPDAGTATVDGVEVTTDRAAAQERLAFLPQDVRFLSALTPRQVLRFYAGLRNAPTDRLDARLEQVALLDAADDPCGTLSGGMRQRLGLALLDLADAPVLLLDEPALSLDPDWREVLMECLQERADAGATILLATHLLEVWRPIVDQVLRCEEGQIRTVEDASTPVPEPAP
jgi:ABC-type multidrug transport system ATPase subunit